MSPCDTAREGAWPNAYSRWCRWAQVSATSTTTRESYAIHCTVSSGLDRPSRSPPLRCMCRDAHRSSTGFRLEIRQGDWEFWIDFRQLELLVLPVHLTMLEISSRDDCCVDLCRLQTKISVRARLSRGFQPKLNASSSQSRSTTIRAGWDTRQGCSTRMRGWRAFIDDVITVSKILSFKMLVCPRHSPLFGS